MTLPSNFVTGNQPFPPQDDVLPRLTASAQGDLRELLLQARRNVQSVKHASRHHAALCHLLARTGKSDEAIGWLEEASHAPPGTAEDHETLGFVAFQLGQHQVSCDFYRKVVEARPDDGTAWYSLATAERSVGDLNAASAACSRAVALNGKLYQAYLLRSQLLVQRPDANHVESLRSALRANSDVVSANIFLNYALGKELDDLKRYDEAFAHFADGAHARRSSMRYDVNLDIHKLARIRQVFDGEVMKRHAAGRGSGHVFILGLPRSGTTLIERVLTGHPNARSNGETDNFSSALLGALPNIPGDIFDRAAKADPVQVASTYMQAAGAILSKGIVIEKLPLNYLYTASIHTALPLAKIVLVRRNPIDNCFAMFSTLFGAAYPFTYDLSELAQYYCAYDMFMKSWVDRLGKQILEVNYEHFVSSPQTVGAAITEHVGLRWSPEMLKIENNSASSATESASQIRRPIYRSAAGRWRNYADRLRPLIESLKSAGVNCND